MQFTAVKYSVAERIATIEIPGNNSNVSFSLFTSELSQALSLAQKNSSVKAVLLTSSAEQWFSGIEKNTFASILKYDFSQNLQDSTDLTKLLQQIYTLRKPVVAMVDGVIESLGCGIIAAADIVFAARETAQFAIPDLRYGLLPASVLYFLVKRIGELHARELLLRGTPLTAERALTIGLVNVVVPQVELEQCTRTFLEHVIISNSSTAMGLLKELLFRIHGMSVADALEYASNLNALSRMTDDSKKGMEAFLKNKPLQW